MRRALALAAVLSTAACGAASRATPAPQPASRSQPDRDGDGIPDAIDLCPDEPEDRDGDEDEDGCPDPDCDDCCAYFTARVIGFHRHEALLVPVVRPALDRLAHELATRPELERVEIVGYAPERDRPELAALRAAAVRDYLIARGVAPSRLTVDGSGRGSPARVGFRLAASRCPPGG